MPLSKYFGGKGRDVMSSMKEEYGPEKGERVFYAVANKQKQRPKDAGKKRGYEAEKRK